MSMRVSRLTPACQDLFNGIIINSIFDSSMCLPYLSRGICSDWCSAEHAGKSQEGGRQTFSPQRFGISLEAGTPGGVPLGVKEEKS